MPLTKRLLLPSLILLPLLPASAAPAAKKPGAPKPPAKPAPKPRSAAPKGKATGGAKKPTPRQPTRHAPKGPAPQATEREEPEAPRPPVAPPVEEAGPRTFALLVGVGKYASPLISRLSFPAQDASALRDAFVDPKLGAIPRDRVLLLADEGATRSAILGAVDTFFKPKVRPGDRMIVFLAGHGIAKGVGMEARSWFLPHDVQGFTTPKLEASGVEMKELASKLGELPASQFALFVDACREDPTPGRGIKSNAMSDVMARSVQVAPRERAVDSVTLFACSVGQRAYEDPALSHGVFTYSILQALRDPALPKDDGFVDAAILARYVGQNVSKWAKNLADTQDADIEQTPEMVAGVLSEGVRVLKLKSGGPESSPLALPASLGVNSVPERAKIFLDGKEVGLSPLVYKFAPDSIPDGEVTLRVESKGGPPAERTIKILPGYLQQVDFFLLKPGVGSRDIAPGAAMPAVPNRPASTWGGDSGESALEKQAREAEARGDIKAAKAAYEQILLSEPGNTVARERLAQIDSRYGNREEMASAIVLLIPLNTAARPAPMGAVPPRGAQAAPDARSLTMLSRAYSALALRLAAGEAPPSPKLVRPKFAPQRWLKPEATWTSWQCTQQALLSAEDAMKLDPQSSDAYVARGLGLIAGDSSAPIGSSKERDAAARLRKIALDDFAKAISLDASNAEAHYGLGLAMRAFGSNLEGAALKTQMMRARDSLKRAIELKPDFYEARREMALCAALMGDREAAIRECEIAISYRGTASDADEVAALELAMSVWHKRAAEAEPDEAKKAAHIEASAGYEEEAKETAKDEDKVMRALSYVGLSKAGFLSLLPAKWTRSMGVLNDPEAAAKSRLNQEKNQAENKVQEKVRKGIGGLFGR